MSRKYYHKMWGGALTIGKGCILAPELISSSTSPPFADSEERMRGRFTGFGQTININNEKTTKKRLTNLLSLLIIRGKK